MGNSGGGHGFKNNYGAVEDFDEGDMQKEDDEQFEEDSPMEKHLTKAILEEIQSKYDEMQQFCQKL